MVGKASLGNTTAAAAESDTVVARTTTARGSGGAIRLAQLLVCFDTMRCVSVCAL